MIDRTIEKIRHQRSNSRMRKKEVSTALSNSDQQQQAASQKNEGSFTCSFAEDLAGTGEALLNSALQVHDTVCGGTIAESPVIKNGERGLLLNSNNLSKRVETKRTKRRASSDKREQRDEDTVVGSNVSNHTRGDPSAAAFHENSLADDLTQPGDLLLDALDCTNVSSMMCGFGTADDGDSVARQDEIRGFLDAKLGTQYSSRSVSRATATGSRQAKGNITKHEEIRGFVDANLGTQYSRRSVSRNTAGRNQGDNTVVKQEESRGDSKVGSQHGSRSVSRDTPAGRHRQEKVDAARQRARRQGSGNHAAANIKRFGEKDEGIVSQRRREAQLAKQQEQDGNNKPLKEGILDRLTRRRESSQASRRAATQEQKKTNNDDDQLDKVVREQQQLEKQNEYLERERAARQRSVQRRRDLEEEAEHEEWLAKRRREKDAKAAVDTRREQRRLALEQASGRPKEKQTVTMKQNDSADELMGQRIQDYGEKKKDNQVAKLRQAWEAKGSLQRDRVVNKTVDQDELMGSTKMRQAIKKPDHDELVRSRRQTKVVEKSDCDELMGTKRQTKVTENTGRDTSAGPQRQAKVAIKVAQDAAPKHQEEVVKPAGSVELMVPKYHTKPTEKVEHGARMELKHHEKVPKPATDVDRMAPKQQAKPAAKVEHAMPIGPKYQEKVGKTGGDVEPVKANHQVKLAGEAEHDTLMGPKQRENVAETDSDIKLVESKHLAKEATKVEEATPTRPSSNENLRTAKLGDNSERNHQEGSAKTDGIILKQGECLVQETKANQELPILPDAQPGKPEENQPNEKDQEKKASDDDQVSTESPKKLEEKSGPTNEKIEASKLCQVEEEKVKHDELMKIVQGTALQDDTKDEATVASSDSASSRIVTLSAYQAQAARVVFDSFNSSGMADEDTSNPIAMAGYQHELEVLSMDQSTADECDLELKHILSNAVTRDFYLSMSQTLCNAVTGCEALASGELKAFHSFRKQLMEAISRDGVRSVQKNIKPAVSIGAVVKEMGKQPQAPGYQLSCSLLSELLSSSDVKHCRQVSYVCLFSAVAEKDRGMTEVMKQTARLVIRALMSEMGLFEDSLNAKFGQQKQDPTRAQQDSLLDTNAKECGARAATCGLRMLMKPKKHKSLMKIMKHTNSKMPLAEALASAILDSMAVDSIRELPPFAGDNPQQPTTLALGTKSNILVVGQSSSIAQQQTNAWVEIPPALGEILALLNDDAERKNEMIAELVQVNADLVRRIEALEQHAAETKEE